MKKTIAVLGGGCWGITLACHLYYKGNNLALWEYDKEKAKILDRKRKLSFLPHLRIPKDIFISSDLNEILAGKNIIVFAIPTIYFRSTAQKVAQILNYPGSTDSLEMLISGTKGLENNTFQRMSGILEEELPKKLHQKIVVLSGPSHAEEVSKGIPTAVTIAGRNKKTTLLAQKLFFTPTFRVYTNSDLAGVELAGAIKNIYAIACGVSDGLGLGDNTKSALVTRSLAEMIRLGRKLGAEVSTFYGLAGIGDLMVTCFSHWSRNRNFGEKIGQGKTVQQALKEIKMTVEGMETTKATYFLARKMKIELPIVNEVYSLIYKNKKPQEAMTNLLMRKPRSEFS
ncbi:MAG TPA: glycerol-3-phosphate dehydrogenase [Elusimicrobia bacterium]|jgi:glycerol-3-phosphate dehydrogenase (NAD(P)+)|nr:glycerol-3-phosphate dehydrogenase [Elusimicrobiota bacterium]